MAFAELVRSGGDPCDDAPISPCGRPLV